LLPIEKRPKHAITVAVSETGKKNKQNNTFINIYIHIYTFILDVDGALFRVELTLPTLAFKTQKYENCLAFIFILLKIYLCVCVLFIIISEDEEIGANYFVCLDYEVTKAKLVKDGEKKRAFNCRLQYFSRN
jgi:predicted membrane channel-forming protein YqfA (hemolysin III family)